MRPFPLAPLLVSALLLTLLVGYVFYATDQRHPADPGLPDDSPTGALRVLTWDAEARIPDEPGVTSRAVVEAVTGWVTARQPHLVVLQSLESRAEAEQIAAALGAGWTLEAVPRYPGEANWLAILAAPPLVVRARHLVDAQSAGFALALEVTTPGRHTVLAVCAGADTDADRSRYYRERILLWCTQHRRNVVILAGGLEGTAAVSGEAPTPGPQVSPGLPSRLGSEYLDLTAGLAPPGGMQLTSRLCVAPIGVPVRGVGVAGTTANASVPVLADLGIP
ncbi:MAG TPA: hypothetical protein PKK06_13745 [Phycisphaerae bacterium]|nr:hypothetical protein [Phycisphaerae bacterium]HNU46290.1 hypothetical protein [Phycisphaerae bacterium]